MMILFRMYANDDVALIVGNLTQLTHLFLSYNDAISDKTITALLAPERARILAPHAHPFPI
jgi:hypothetical protein